MVTDGSPQLVEGPLQHGFMVSFNGRSRDACPNEYVFLRWLRRWIIEPWRTDYNTVRPYGRLGGMASAEFTNRHRQGRMDAEATVSAA